MARIVTPPSTVKHPPAPSVAVPQDKIAKRAYEKWQKRGCHHGGDLRDWLEAEAELKAEASKTKTPPTSSSRR